MLFLREFPIYIRGFIGNGRGEETNMPGSLAGKKTQL